MNAFPNNFPINLNGFNNQNMMMNMNNNNIFFPNLMNNQIQMMQIMQMNQMNQLNQMNQINQVNQMNQMNPMNQMAMMQNNMDEQNQKNFVLNPDQKPLIDKIIKFYQGSKKTIYMNYNEPNQIRQLVNNLDTNSPLLQKGNDISDPLPYIHEKKKSIRFINHDSKIFNVKVPISFD